MEHKQHASSTLRTMSKDNLLKLHFTSPPQDNNINNINNNNIINSNNNNKTNTTLPSSTSSTTTNSNYYHKRINNSKSDLELLQSIDSKILNELNDFQMCSKNKINNNNNSKTSHSNGSPLKSYDSSENSSEEDVSPSTSIPLQSTLTPHLKSPLDHPLSLKPTSDSEEESELVVSTSSNRSTKILSYSMNIPNNNYSDSNDLNINTPNSTESTLIKEFNNTKVEDLPANMVVINGVKIDRTTPVNFNVGGTLFASSLATILRAKDSLLYKIVEMQIQQIQKDQIIFIDRNPNYFACIIDYLRTLRYFPPVGINTAALLEEATFFRLKGLESAIKEEPELSRTQIIKILNSCYDFPRLQGIWLNKINLTGLDLSCGLFNYSNISNGTISSATLNQASFANCRIENAIISCNMGSNCVFNRATIVNVNFTDNVFQESQAFCTDFSGSDLSGTSFACSDLRGSRFIGCKMFGTDLSHCNLSECIFIDAKFDEHTNISCAITTNTNFDGCNKDSALCKKNFKKPKTIRVKNKISTLPGMML